MLAFTIQETCLMKVSSISTPTITVEATATVNSTVYTAYTAPSAVSVSVEKRDVALPPFVSGYPASRISSGCSCLTISTSTSTSTSTTTPATTVPATVSTLPITIFIAMASTTLITKTNQTVINTVTAPQETSTVIASPTTVTTTTTTTSYYVLPTLCDPVNFRDYRNFVESRPYLYRSIVGSTKQDCCLTCYNAKNCLSFIFDATRLQCNYYLVTSQASLSTRTDVCPLGVTVNSRQETPGWAYLPQNYGPCLASAPL